MQISYFQPVYRPLTLLLSGMSLSCLISLINLVADGAASLSHLVAPAYAEHQLDHSTADGNERTNGSLQKNGSGNFDRSARQNVQMNEVEPPLVAIPTNFWQKIRAGFALEKYDSHLVKLHEKRFSASPKHFERILERAKPYLPYLLEQTKHHNLPSEIVLLPLIESGYNPRIYSPRGAAGLWQFMPLTGLQYGLKQDWWYEGRRDITYSTEAALQHLMDLNNMFDGDWPLSIAAYNLGSNGIKRAIRLNRRLNRPTNLNSLQLNSETRNYYPKLIAVKNIIQNPAEYGVELPEISIRSPFKIIEFDFQVDLVQLSKAIDVEVLRLALLNPGLRRHTTPPDGPHRILIPTRKLNETLDWKRHLHPADAVVSTVHVVKAGETLSDIAQQHAIPLASLIALNTKQSDLIHIGETIRIPPNPATVGNLNAFAGAETVHTVVSGDSLSQIAQTYRVQLSDLRSLNGIDHSTDQINIGQKIRIPSARYSVNSSFNSSASVSDLRSRMLHRVIEGESLWSIARKYNVSVGDVIRWNAINGSQIEPGQELIVYIN